MAQEHTTQLTLEQPVEHASRVWRSAGEGARGGESWEGHLEQEAAGHGAHDPLSAESLMGHVKDAEAFHFPRFFSPSTEGVVKLPQLRDATGRSCRSRPALIRSTI